MFRLAFIGLLFTFSAAAEPSGSIKEGPSSIRSFRPLSTSQDDAIELYFTEAGPLAIEFYEHLTLLANPWLGGRQPGSKGSDIAGQYIVWNLEQYDISPAFEDGSSWYQPFDFAMESAAPEVLHSFVTIEDIALIEGRDYVVLGNSGSGDISAPLTFVGYAIEDGKDGYSSFDEDSDLIDQIALMLRYEPLDEKGASIWAGQRFSPNANIRDKMQAVIDRGAIGVILVNPPNCRDGRRGLETSTSGRFGVTDIPVIQMSEDAINAILIEEKLIDLQKKADAGAITTQQTKSSVSIMTVVDSGGMHAKNVGGVLAGKGDLADEWLIIGGHYDHVGYGYTGTRYPGELHHGADDNASGSSLVLMMARMLSEHYAATDDESLRSVLFIFFDAEEAGLYGSSHFVKNPTIDLAKANAMINLDMVGNLSDNNILIGGSGTAEEFETLLPEVLSTTPLTASLMPGGTGPSDHTNFYREDIPVLFFFTGLSDEYHTPKDQPFTTNPAGAARLAELLNNTSMRLVDDPKLTFTTSVSSSRGSNRGSRPTASVRLGIQPSYSAELETGILIEGVSEGTSAEDAGLQAGDILLAWEKEELTGGRKLMELLRASSPDDKVTFLVQRDGNNIEIDVTLKAP